jgi:glycosyltransferase involved in cell wall biosynthesis
LSDLHQLLGDRLILHGIMPALEAAKIVAGCEVLLAPSREEMFGNQLIEALLLATFPLVSEGTALAENVRKFGCGQVVAAEDVRLISSLLSDGLYGQSDRTIPARKKIVEEMGPMTIASSHLALYEEIAAR